MNKTKKAALLIDGAYFEIGVNLYKRRSNNNLIWSPQAVEMLLQKLQFICGVEFVSRKFITAETEETNSKPHKKMLHHSLKQNQISVDIRDFKKKEELCPFCKRTYERNVQAEVDVAIAVSICEEIFYKTKNPVDTIVLIAGDRDFKDALKSCIEKKQVDVILIGFYNTMSFELKSLTGLRFLPIMGDLLLNVFQSQAEVIVRKDIVMPESNEWDLFGFLQIEIPAFPPNEAKKSKKGKKTLTKRHKMDVNHKKAFPHFAFC